MLQAGRWRIQVLMRWIFLNLSNLSSRTMALGSNPREMSTRNLPWGVKGGRRIGLTTLTPSVSLLSRENMEASTSHNCKGLHDLLQRRALSFFFMQINDRALVTCSYDFCVQ
jgi:hypothetical protein